MACPRARICLVGQVYTPAGLIIDSLLHDTLGHEYTAQEPHPVLNKCPTTLG
jgi:hypothetical protein